MPTAGYEDRAEGEPPPSCTGSSAERGYWALAAAVLAPAAHKSCRVCLHPKRLNANMKVRGNRGNFASAAGGVLQLLRYAGDRAGWSLYSPVRMNAIWRCWARANRTASTRSVNRATMCILEGRLRHGERECAGKRPSSELRQIIGGCDCVPPAPVRAKLIAILCAEFDQRGVGQRHL